MVERSDGRQRDSRQDACTLKRRRSRTRRRAWSAPAARRRTATRGGATSRRESGRRVHALDHRHVDSNRYPGEDPVLGRVAEQRVLHDGVEGRRRGLREDRAPRVRRERLRVGAVCGGGFHLRDQTLIEEDLADVRHLPARVRVVAQHGTVVGPEHVNVRRAAGVVTRERREEVDESVRVRRRQSAVERLRRVRRVGAVAVAARDHARVHARDVAVPEVDVEILDRFARVHVDDLELLRTLRHLWLEDALRRGPKERGWVRRRRDACERRFVALCQHGGGVELAAPAARCLHLTQLLHSGRSARRELLLEFADVGCVGAGFDRTVRVSLEKLAVGDLGLRLLHVGVSGVRGGELEGEHADREELGEVDHFVSDRSDTCESDYDDDVDGEVV
ncbi:hypothetical protein PybrP1_004047 [[Pythium] brassicae (nom. inval.)]|nr:hypothetical protein PybrP1_004047 [[Pythium] brassicae (nom. inval.)]